jgi:DNA-binding CsgD family transcriptional regulator
LLQEKTIQLIASFTQNYPIHQHRSLSLVPIKLFMCVKKRGKMAFATPYIEHGILTYAIGTQWYTLSIDSQEWQEWLSNRCESFRFADRPFSYTARLEQRENKCYWYAYCTYRKKVYNAYLGKSEELTFARMQAVSTKLYRRCTSTTEMKIHASAEVPSVLPENDEQKIASQMSTDTQQKGEQPHMEVETVYTFPSKAIDNNNTSLFASLVEPLTKREREILHYLVIGCANKEIAQQLVLSEGTIKWHLKNLYNKLNVHTRSQAIARARALHL